METINESNFNHWYLKILRHPNSIFKVEVENSDEGYATTNILFATVENKLSLLFRKIFLTTEKCKNQGLF